jgi:hypothetical protein
MATVNALKCKHLENEAKMHFTYIWQYLAFKLHLKGLHKIIFKLVTKIGNHSLSKLLQ